MFSRIRPTKDNGVVAEILDQNCEVADIYASEPWPFTLPGGLTEDCSDLTVTVRMLEGDANLDCEVNVLDEQAIAFRYGSFFGLLLRQPTTWSWRSALTSTQGLPVRVQARRQPVPSAYPDGQTPSGYP
jgi:hypothetical protein